MKANLATKKQLQDAKYAKEKAITDAADKEEALHKLQEKNEQDGEDSYKKLIDSVPKGTSFAEQSEQTPDHVYELAASIIETNPKYGVAEANTIGQDELVGRHEVIRIDKNITAEAKPAQSTSVKSKVQAAVKNVSEKAVPAKSADSADDFDNIQVAESADSANSADQFANAGDEDEDDEDLDEDDESQVQQTADLGQKNKAGAQTDAAAFQVFKNRLDKHPEDLIEALPTA